MQRFLRLSPILLFLLAVVGLSLALPASAQCSPRTDWDVYAVARGDTLSSIARRFGTTTATLIAGNCLANPNYLLVGQPIRVPPGSSAPDFPAYSSDIAATFQWFDSGFMIWRADTGSIWVFIQQGRSGGGIVRQFPLNVYGGLSGDARYMGEIPPGRGLPVFGFAKVYTNFADVRAALGWAAGSEQGFLMRVQPSGGGPYFTIWRPDGLAVRIFGDQTFQTLSDPYPPSPTPPPPTYSTGATFQPFQYGFMVWRADTGEISVYFGANTGELATYPVWQYGPLPGQMFVPLPDNYWFPIEFGFGKVWHNIPGVRERLGWATGGERGYTMLIDNTTPGAPSFTLPGGETVYNVGGNTWAITGVAGLPFGEVPPTPTAPPGSSGPQVSLFAVSPIEVMPGDPVSVSWEVYNAGNIGLKVTYRADYRLFFDYTSDALPAFSSTTITIPDHTDVFNSEASFQLYWVYDAENWVPIEGATRTVWIGCPYPLFWNQSGCAYAPEQQLPALYQTFERGFMLRAGEAVYPVIFNDEHQATIFAEIERIEIGAPPDGLYAPDAAFTDVWTSTPRYLELLGWATAPAQSYTARVQTEHYYIRGDNMRKNYVTLPDGRVLQLSGSVFGGPAVSWDWVR